MSTWLEQYGPALAGAGERINEGAAIEGLRNGSPCETWCELSATEWILSDTATTAFGDDPPAWSPRLRDAS